MTASAACAAWGSVNEAWAAASVFIYNSRWPFLLFLLGVVDIMYGSPVQLNLHDRMTWWSNLKKCMSGFSLFAGSSICVTDFKKKTPVRANNLASWDDYRCSHSFSFAR